MELENLQKQLEEMNNRYSNNPDRRKAIEALLKIIKSVDSSPRDVIIACKVILENA